MNQLIESLQAQKAPQHILTALELFQFQSPLTDRLSCLTQEEQRRFFQWCDAGQLTLMLPHVCHSLPRWVHEAVSAKATRHELRFNRLKRELFEIVEAFDDAKLTFVMLKGLSHSPTLTPDARSRGQGDIDLWLLGSSVYKAREVLRKLGYVPTLPAKSRHLAPMARPSKWEWRGDIFDPEMPISVELHYELWSTGSEYIPVPGLSQFWERKKLRDFDGRLMHVLCDEDLLAFASLHLLLHLLHGELPLQRAWEIARFLDLHADDDVFWRLWRGFHPAALRQLELCVFHLVTEWFGCQCRRELRDDADTLPVRLSSWLRNYSFAPLSREWKPNKSELWLHLALINETRYKLLVFFRRLFPVSLPLYADRGKPASRMTTLLALMRQSPRLTRRFIYHAGTFFPTLLDGLRWLGAPKS